MTLKQILIFARKHNACKPQLNKFEEFLKSGDELSAWQTVQGNIRWLKDGNKLRITHKEVYDKSGGIGKTWHENGNLAVQCTYNSEGKMEGLFKRWYSDGQLYQQCTYNSEGIREGLFQEWHDNGQLYQQCTYNSEGKRIGLFQRWYSNGELWE